MRVSGAVRRWGGACLLALAACASAAELPGDGAPVQADVLVDATGHLPAEAVWARFQAGEGRPHDPSRALPLGQGAAIWLRPRWPRITEQVDAVLSLAHPGFDRLDLWTRHAADLWTVRRSGDDVPAADWPTPSLFPALPVPLEPDAPPQVLVRVDHGFALPVPLQLAQRSSFDASQRALLLALGAYLGFVALVMLLSLSNAWTLGGRPHLLYAAYVAAIAVAQASLTGVAGEFVVPNSAWANNLGAQLTPLPALALGVWFVFGMLPERDRARLGWLCWAHTLLCAATMAAILTLPILHYPQVTTFYFVATALLVAVALRVILQGGVSGRWWFVGGFAALFLPGALPVLRNLHVLPMNAFTQFGGQLGAAIEVPLLLMGLYVHSRDKRDRQVRMEALARTDPQTGVVGHKALLGRLAAMLQRRGGMALCLRIANARELLKEFGGTAAEALPLRAAACAAAAMKEGDTLGRLRNGDFMLLLPGCQDRAEAMAAAQQMIAGGLADSVSLPNGAALKFQVALVQPEADGAGADEVAQRLAQLLDALAETQAGTCARWVA